VHERYRQQTDDRRQTVGIATANIRMLRSHVRVKTDVSVSTESRQSL